MLFNSLEFCLFFPFVTAFYFLLPHKWRWLLLLLASCGFYMAFIPAYLAILLFTILIDYAAGIGIEKAEGRQKKALLVLSIAANLGVLAFFKYYNFFIFNLNEAFSAHFSLLNIILPIGLSFHTFQAMSYTIEVYKGRQKAEKHLGIYALYVMYYPQLVAGPIERPQNIFPQLYKKQTFDYERVVSGLRLMAWGLFKKIAIADRLAMFVDTAYSNVHAFQNVSLVVAAVFFSFQIYCDFSGYSDIAVGVSRVIGINLMQNFRQPYFATSLSEFWRRWHISLSTWFRDYVYIPLGGNTKGGNLLIVFLLSGFWHGANWTFIIWGLIHGIGVLVSRRFPQMRADFRRYLPTQFSIFNFQFSIFFFITFAWIFFRAKTLTEALLFIQNMGTGWADIAKKGVDLQLFTLGISPIQLGLALVGIFILLLVDACKSHFSITAFLQKMPIFLRYSLYWTFLILLYTMGMFGTKSAFIYFQF